ncbi:hypothetical protein GCM10008983_11770 [Lentibacillus halophilus]|uniref:Uncharacterized protein n=1 Tax=Lentibacillus halophilus TaxID=295065 RepID=A0ABP3J0Z9_9BACI
MKSLDKTPQCDKHEEAYQRPRKAKCFSGAAVKTYSTMFWFCPNL